jgi:hypothetical protein
MVMRAWSSTLAIVPCPTRVIRVDLVLLYLRTRIEPVARRELEFHPEVFPELWRFVLVPCRAHPSEAEALKKWNEDLFDKVVFAGSIEERRQLLCLLDLLFEREGGIAGRTSACLRPFRKVDRRTGRYQG